MHATTISYKRDLKSLFSGLLLLLLFTACQKEEHGTSKEQQAKTLLNVSYGNDTAQRMDVYLPAGRSAASTKVIVMIHGGSWNSGSKGELATYIDTFKKRLPDYAVINMNYRLASYTQAFPAPEEDVKAAITFIADQAAAYGFNKDDLALLGVSAGAHLALLQAYKYNSPVAVKTVIDFFGPTDLEQMYNQPWHPLVPLLLQAVTGTTPAANVNLYRQSSPINYVSAQSPPTLILHGDADEIVNISQSYALQQKLAAAGVANEMLVYPGEGHGWYGAKLVHSFDKVVAFLNAHMP